MIKLEKISKKFDENYVVEDVSLDFSSKETVAIIGPSGSGKTTLLKCINYLEPPTKGHIYIDGHKITAKNRLKLCKKIGMVFQNFNLFPHMDVQGNLIYSPTKVFGMSYRLATEKAERLLGMFGLQNKMNVKPSALSGGQKQRVAIARALMLDPQMILFDEPTSALDSEVICDVIDAINALKHQMSAIIVTHHIKFAKIIADRVIFMNQGKVLADQSKDDFFSNPKSHRARIFLENIKDL